MPLPQSLMSINSWAFCECSCLKDIIIPEGVQKIGESAFKKCGLQSITIPESVSEICAWTFNKCFGLTDIKLPSSVTKIGDFAFGECRSLRDIIYKGKVSEWQKIAKGSNWDVATTEYTVHCTDGTISKRGKVKYY